MTADDTHNARRLRGSPLRRQGRYYVGVDLGHTGEYAAIVAIERAERANAERDPLTWSFASDSRFHIRHADRIAQADASREVLELVKRLLKRDSVPGSVTVVVHAEGAGDHVADLLSISGIGFHVLSVGTSARNEKSGHHVGRTELMAGLQHGLQRRFLQVGVSGSADGLTQQLKSMLPSAGSPEPTSAPGHGNLMLALALAWWRANREAATFYKGVSEPL